MNLTERACEEISGTTDVWCPGTEPVDFLANTGGLVDPWLTLIVASVLVVVGGVGMVLCRATTGRWIP